MLLRHQWAQDRIERQTLRVGMAYLPDQPFKIDDQRYAAILSKRLRPELADINDQSITYKRLLAIGAK